MNPSLEPYRYAWPPAGWRPTEPWQSLDETPFVARPMPESLVELAGDSRWPAFYPSPISLVTTTDGTDVALEKVVGVTVVNRFPYVLAVSVCAQTLSARHHERSRFMDMLERGGAVAVQFLPPGPGLDRAMNAIVSVPEAQTYRRVTATGLSTRKAETNHAPVFDASYLVYEARLADPGEDFDGHAIYPTPWIDAGSHRVYFLEITAIQLRQDIAAGESQIHWRSLPDWSPRFGGDHRVTREGRVETGRYRKTYTPQYAFPSPGTVAFESQAASHGMAVQFLPPAPQDQVEVDNDRARWPCFFPSSAGIITTWADEGVPNIMPCSSTTIVSRHPLIVAPCISYASINDRYAPRATLHSIRRTGRFTCGVPYLCDRIVDAIAYAGNISIEEDREKAAHAGLDVVSVDGADWGPVLADLPIHFECDVRDEVRLGTHAMLLGEVQRVLVRRDVTTDNPVAWYPWASVEPCPQVEHTAPAPALAGT
jgi:flavin reductase (DIM6/NTAB) family NADH-FMN oxidoreductase RutF